MGTSEEQRLLERLLADSEFRARFELDPAGAARAAGFGRFAADLAAADPAPMRALDIRESRSSLAGALLAAAAEGFALVEFGGRLLAVDEAAAAVGGQAIPPGNGATWDADWYGMTGSGGPLTPETEALLHNENASFEAAGIEDLQAGRIDPRVISVLTEISKDHEIVVSCTCSDHAMNTAGGSISNHYYGRGIDIASVDGKPVNSSNAAAKEVAEALAKLDPSIRPTEIGSPWALSGAAYFTDADHQDHLHVAFDDPIEPGWKVPAATAAPAADASDSSAASDSSDSSNGSDSSDGPDSSDEDDAGDEDDDAGAAPATAAATPAAPLSTDPDDWEGNLDDEDAGEDEVDGSNEDEADEAGGEDDDGGTYDDEEDDDEEGDDEGDDEEDDDEGGDDEEEDEDEDEGADEPGEGSNGEDATDDDAGGDSDDDSSSDSSDDDSDSDDGSSSDSSDGGDSSGSSDDAGSDGSSSDDSEATSAQPDPGAEAPDDYPGDDAPREEVAAWMASEAEKRGLPPELPVMASLVESGLRNLSYGDADSVGFFQMRTSIWDQGPYAGYQDSPELQLQWFLDKAEAVKAARIADGRPVDDPGSYGEWIADVERPAEQYRGRYQLRLDEAGALLEAAGSGSGSAVAGNEAQVLKAVDPDAADASG